MMRIELSNGNYVDVSHPEYEFPKTRRKQPWEVWRHIAYIPRGEEWKYVSRAVAERIKQLYLRGIKHPIEIAHYLPQPLHPRIIADVLNNYVGVKKYKHTKHSRMRSLNIIVARLEEQGLKPRDIAEKLGLSKSAVYKYIKNKKRYQRHNTCEKRDKILRLYKQGYSTLAIARMLGLPKSSVYYVVTNRICKPRNENNVGGGSDEPVSYT